MQVCPVCGGRSSILNEGQEMPEEMRREAERIAKGIYDGTIAEGTIDPAMTKMVADELRKAVIKGFGKDFPKVNYGTPDYKMLSNLELSVYHFSAASDYNLLKSLTLALKDENGIIRSFNDFKTEAFKIVGTYNVRHLKTEFDTAIASSQMAARWVDFEKNKAVAEWLRYDTVGDSRVRDSHKLLNGIIKKVDDVFWDNYYPPNSWNCRCDVTQIVHGAETRSNEIMLPDDVPTMFKTNMAKQGIVFPKGHPYYVNTPDNILKKAEVLRTPQYSPVYKSKSGGTVQISQMADTVDKEDNIIKSNRLADFGEDVRIRPHIKDAKNPEIDLYKGTQIGDFTRPRPKGDVFKTSYESRIKAKGKQGCQIPVFEMDEFNYKKLDMVRAIKNKALWQNKHTKAITELWLLFEHVLVKITREDITLGSFVSKLP